VQRNKQFTYSLLIFKLFLGTWVEMEL